MRIGLEHPEGEQLNIFEEKNKKLRESILKKRKSGESLTEEEIKLLEKEEEENDEELERLDQIPEN